MFKKIIKKKLRYASMPYFAPYFFVSFCSMALWAKSKAHHGPSFAPEPWFEHLCIKMSKTDSKDIYNVEHCSKHIVSQFIYILTHILWLLNLK